MTARVEAERAIAGAVRQIVADYALGTESLHANWRCGYPDTYGPCNCVDEFVADAVKVLADLMAERQAEAWEKQLRRVEGWHHAGLWNASCPGVPTNIHLTRPNQLEAKCRLCGFALVAMDADGVAIHVRPDPKDTREGDNR